jgi:hypothetical protein
VGGLFVLVVLRQHEVEVTASSAQFAEWDRFKLEGSVF